MFFQPQLVMSSGKRSWHKIHFSFNPAICGLKILIFPIQIPSRCHFGVSNHLPKSLYSNFDKNILLKLLCNSTELSKILTFEQCSLVPDGDKQIVIP